MVDKKLLIYTGGGIVAGVALNTILQKFFFSNAKSTPEYPYELFERENINDTGFSDLTIQLGSPTSSSVIDSAEYPLYSAKDNYPDLDGNKYA